MNSVMKNYDVPHRVENIIVEFIGPTERIEHTILQRELRNKSFKNLGIEKKRIWKTQLGSFVEIEGWSEENWGEVSGIHVHFRFLPNGNRVEMILRQFIDNFVFIK